MKIPSILAGVAGEYFVAAELSRHGYIASISLRNTRGIDILATNQTSSRSITIQCKTNQVAQKKWILGKKSERFVSDNHYYVFVAFSGVQERPSYHIVPSREVSKQISAGHKRWLRTLGRDGRQHVDNEIRNFFDRADQYLEKWDLLGL
jgi:hypothetical protein